ncbi:unnamed protein product [Heterobilharzia americana]|nr:unnamed protein product [Heterobilharzia americana]
MNELLLPLTVGLIWGSTNIGMKHYSDRVFKCSAFFLLNQCASILFMYGFKHTQLSTGVAVANATALLASALTSYCIYQEKIGWTGCLGVILICLGTGLLNN